MQRRCNTCLCSATTTASIDFSTTPSVVERVFSNTGGGQLGKHPQINFPSATRDELFEQVHTSALELENGALDSPKMTWQPDAKQSGTEFSASAIGTLSAVLATTVVGGLGGVVGLAASGTSAAAFAIGGLGYQGGEIGRLVGQLARHGIRAPQDSHPQSDDHISAPSEPSQEHLDGVRSQAGSPQSPNARARRRLARPEVDLIAVMATLVHVWDTAERSARTRLQRLLLYVWYKRPQQACQLCFSHSVDGSEADKNGDGELEYSEFHSLLVSVRVSN